MYSKPLPLQAFYDRDTWGTMKRNAEDDIFSQKTFRDNLALAFADMRRKGVADPSERHFIVNISGVPDRAVKKPPHYKEGMCPTITSTRVSGRAYYATYLRRRLTVREMARLQGAPTCEFAEMFRERTLSISQQGKMVGNAMSVPIVMKLCHQLLLSAGFGWRPPISKQCTI